MRISGYINYFLVLLTASSGLHCSDPSETLPLTLHRRSVLDLKVRMLTLKFGKDKYAAYDLQSPGLYKVWRGGVVWSGANFNNLKQLQPESYGNSYLEEEPYHFMIRKPDGSEDSLQLRFDGYTLLEEGIQIHYSVAGEDYDWLQIDETPVFEVDDRMKFVRRYEFTEHVGYTLIIDGIAVDDMHFEQEYQLETLPPVSYPQNEVIARTSYYWLETTGCNTCHDMDVTMVGPSYKAIAARYDRSEETVKELIEKVKSGGSGNWGEAIMISHPQLAEADIDRMVRDILSLDPEGSASPRTVSADDLEEKKTVPGFGSSLTDVHPAFDLQTIRPEWFKPRVGAMAFTEDGRLLVSTWDSIGSVFSIDGVETGDTSQIEIREIASGLAEPLGMEVVGEDVFVMQKQELTQLIDHNGDLIIDEYRSICADFDVTSDFHEFAYDIEYLDGYLYGTLGIAMRLMTTELQPLDRGSAFKVDLDGDLEIIARGLRQPNGIGIGVDNQLFVTENQGRWVPACKLIHLREGDFHGCVQRQGSRFDGLEMVPPSVWLPQDEIGNSPSEPFLLTEGPYAGQMAFGEVSHGGMNRVYLEKVDGAYQGCVFRFCQGLEAGINRIVRGPDDALYLGGVGMVGGWTHKGAQYGLQKLVYNGEIPFEMLAVRSTQTGFDIEFTRPVSVDISPAEIPLQVSQWSYEPTANYGGPKLDQHTLQIAAAEFSQDRKKLRLEIEDLKVGYVVYFSFSPAFRSEKDEKLWSGEAWYTLNAIPQLNI